MMTSLFILLGVSFVLLLTMGIGIFWVLKSSVRVPETHQAMVVTTSQGTHILIGRGRIVLPWLHRVAFVDLSAHRVQLTLQRTQSVVSRDCVHFDVVVSFFVKVRNTEAAVRSVAQHIGCAQATQQDTLDTLFTSLFSEAVQSVVANLECRDLEHSAHTVQDHLMRSVGIDLGHGYVLESVAVDSIQRTPSEHRNIPDVPREDPVTSQDLSTVQGDSDHTHLLIQTLETRLKRPLIDRERALLVQRVEELGAVTINVELSDKLPYELERWLSS